jgi:Ca2+-binding RTX toxin-like protein
MVITNSNYLFNSLFNLLGTARRFNLNDVIAGLGGNRFIAGLNANDALIGGLGNGTIYGSTGAGWAGYNPIAYAIALDQFSLFNKGRLGLGLLTSIKDIPSRSLPAYLIDTSGATLLAASRVAFNLSLGRVLIYGSYLPPAFIMSQLKQAARYGLVGLMAGDSANNYLYGGAGNDTMLGGAGNDTINGGSGMDTANYSSLGGLVSLGALGVLNKGGLGVDSLVGIETIVGSSLLGDTVDLSAAISSGTVVVSGTSTNLTSGQVTVNGTGAPLPLSFTVQQFENVIGSNFNDTITGDAANNSLNGGAGNDTIVGGLGGDTLIGGLGNDVFKYSSVAESIAGVTSRDTIADFQLGLDTLDLSTIDSNSSIALDQAFSFLGNSAAFTSVGQLRYQLSGGSLLLFGNTDANLATSEFELQLSGLASIAATNIIL